MISDGIRTPRIKIPKALAGKQVKDWPGVLALEATPATRLVWRLAEAAIKRWSVAPDDRCVGVEYNGTIRFEGNHWRAIQALDRCVDHGFTGAGLSIDDLIGWAQIEVEFQRDLPAAHAAYCFMTRLRKIQSEPQ